MTMRGIFRLIVMLPLASGFTVPANAACSLPSACACTVTAAPLQFGVYNPLRPVATDSTGNIQMACSATPAASMSYQIQLSAGGGGSYESRTLSGAGGSSLRYNLYTDPARTQIWGDSSGATATVTGDFPVLLSTNAIQNHPVYGRVVAGQTDASSGVYLDSILITVTY